MVKSFLDQRFLLDGMLGSLARWLRVLGFDTVYYIDEKDETLQKEARETGRILVTRDNQLYHQAKKKGLRTVLIKSEETTEQLREMVKSLDLEIIPKNTKCPKCNGDLKPINKEEVIGLVPSESFKAFDDYWICTDCKSLYWKGSHWVQIQKTLQEIENSKSL